VTANARIEKKMVSKKTAPTKSSEKLTLPEAIPSGRFGRAADLRFVYSIKDSAVYCRPSCVARRARPDDVIFFPSIADAVGAGVRACKLCRPGAMLSIGGRAVKIAAACRMIEKSAENLPLAATARRVGMSVHHFHRVFKSLTGVTPKEYARADLAAKVRRSLSRGRTVTEAIYAAGYNSNGRFYSDSNELLGMTPSQYRSGGVLAEIHFATSDSAYGVMLVARTHLGICAVLLGETREAVEAEFRGHYPHAAIIKDDVTLMNLLQAVIRYVETPFLYWHLPIDIRGTAFQQRVWKTLQQLPLGTVVSYDEVAKRLWAHAPIKPL
jgi:AraC family transcriptional regulator, regulatory protein of adaptative response / methylated-DNA-[protein]-cysteine methyltransferase